MAKFVKCPRCQGQIESTSLSPGATVRCAECGAMVRIPTGNTGNYPRVPAPAAAPAPPPASPAPAPAGRPTALRTRPQSRGGSETRLRAAGRPAPPKKSNPGVLVGVLVGALAMAVAVIAVMASRSGEPTRIAEGKRAAAGGSGGGAIEVTPAPIQKATGPLILPAGGSGPKDPGAAPAPDVPKTAEDPARVNWDHIMLRDLRSGGALDDLSRPEGQAVARVRQMGKGAYPYIVKYIDHEEIAIGIAAVRVLNELTGRSEPLPKEATKAQFKKSWEDWLQSNK